MPVTMTSHSRQDKKVTTETVRWMDLAQGGEVREGGLDSRTEASVCTNAGADEPADTEREIRLERAQKAQALFDKCG